MFFVIPHIQHVRVDNESSYGGKMWGEELKNENERKVREKEEEIKSNRMYERKLER